MSLISSVASIVGVKETSTPVTAAISEFDTKTNSEKSGTLRAFQYFPEQINDTRAPRYSSRDVPGSSHPILGFINGGSREIGFDAVFTQEENPEPRGLGGLLTGTFNFNPVSLLSDSVFGKSPQKNTVDVAAAIAWLRSFTYPDYVNDVAVAPPMCILYLPGSGIVGHGNFPESIVGVMTGCNVTYEAFHRNGAPRIVVVSLTFLETVQVGANWKYIGRSDVLNASQAYNRYTKQAVGIKRPAQQGGGGILGAVGKLLGRR